MLLLFVLVLFLTPLAVIEVMGDVIINEVELGPIQGDAPWIELYNPDTLQASLENIELHLYHNNAIRIPTVISFPEGALIESEEYYLVFLEEEPTQHFINTHNVTIILLDKTAGQMDVIMGLGDVIADDKTWQRFPDGVDSDAFRDWTFRTATQGQDNGNLGQLVAECSLDPFCWGPLDVFFHNEHRVTVDDRVFLIETFYDTKRIDVDFILDEKKITISQKPPNFAQAQTRSSFMHVTIPDELLGGTYSVFADGKQKPFHVISDRLNNRIIINDIGDSDVIEVVGTLVIPEFTVGVMILVIALVFSVFVTRRCCYASKLGSSSV